VGIAYLTIDKSQVQAFANCDPEAHPLTVILSLVGTRDWTRTACHSRDIEVLYPDTNCLARVVNLYNLNQVTQPIYSS